MKNEQREKKMEEVNVKEIVQTLDEKIKKYSSIILGIFIIIVVSVAEYILFLDHLFSHAIHEIMLHIFTICLILAFSVFFQYDVIKRFRISQKLQESKKKYLNAYNRANFYKNILMHDINGVLSNIKLSIELSAIQLKGSSRMKDVEEVYEIIREQITKGSSLVSNIQKLSQIEESVSMMKPVEVNDILIKEIDFIIKSDQTREVKIRRHGFEQGVFVNANDLLINLFNNLLNNSIKHNDSHIIEIDIKLAKVRKRSINYVKLEFSDNGIGISNERKETLFEEEYVKDISSKGLGIGLTLVKKIVDSYKGKINVEDRIKDDHSKGSNFIILIPEVFKYYDL